MAINTDDQIIEMLHRKDVNGISLLYDKYSPALYGTILKVVNNTEIAEETLQDTFTKIWKNFEQYDASKGKLFTWLINIARNAAIDATRQKGFSRKNQSIENVVSTIDAQQSTSFNPEIIDVKQLTQKLTPEYQVLIDLIYFKGYTQVEVAESLNIPLGTVKTRLRMAIGVLKSLF